MEKIFEQFNASIPVPIANIIVLVTLGVFVVTWGHKWWNENFGALRKFEIARKELEIQKLRLEIDKLQGKTAESSESKPAQRGELQHFEPIESRAKSWLRDTFFHPNWKRMYFLLNILFLSYVILRAIYAHRFQVTSSFLAFLVLWGAAVFVGYFIFNEFRAAIIGENPRGEVLLWIMAVGIPTLLLYTFNLAWRWI